MREWDRLERVKRQARRSGAPATVTLAEWLASVAAYRGLCALCELRPFEVLSLLAPERGVTPGNCFPACRSCERHLVCGFDGALSRVQVELMSPGEH